MFTRFSRPLKFSRPLQNLGLVILSAAAATLAALGFASRPSRFIVPFIFIAALVLVAMRCGALVGIVGSIVAGAIFAYLLYPPLHSVQVHDAGDRAQLAWVVLAGIALSYLFAGPGPHTPHSKR